MKKYILNSGLVVVLAGLLFFPVLGFGFISLQGPLEIPEDSEVLGVEARTIVKRTMIIDQVDLSLNMGAGEVQKFYNVIPEEYVSGDYEFLVIIPETVKDMGVQANLVSNELSADLEVVFPGGDVLNFNATILVLKNVITNTE